MFHSNHSMILSLVLTISTATLARCDDAQVMDSSQTVWNVEFEPVPEILRMHCVPLQSGRGIVVKRIGNDFDAPFQLQAGDVLLSTSGNPIQSIHDLPHQLPSSVLVLRLGQPMMLGQAQPVSVWDGYLKGFQAPGKLNHPVFPCYPGTGISASAFARSKESVSVSQNGDQISIEMSLPNLHAGKINYRGTRDQIRREVENSNLPPAAIQRVLEAIR